MSIRPRSMFALCTLVAIGSLAEAGTLTDVRAVTTQTTVSGKSFNNLLVNCPSGAFALSGLATPSHPESVQISGRWGMNGSAPVPFVDGVHAASTGMRFSIVNPSPEPVVIDTEVICSPLSGPVTGASTVVADRTLQGGERRYAQATCPAGQVALGGGYDAPGGPVLSDYPLLPFYVGGGYQVPDGTHPAPVGWEVDARSFASSPSSVHVTAFCFDVANIATVVGSAPLQPGQYAFRGLAIDDSRRILGSGAAGGVEGYVRAAARWTQSLGVNFSHGPATYPVGGGGFAGPFVRNLDATMPQVVKVGLIVEPFTGMPPAERIVDVVEYKHDVTDFYFSTAIQGEITDLDAGLHLGWKRTGGSYKAWAVGSGGPAGRQPVFRFFAPSLGSHFYTGGVLEGHHVRWGFGGTWQIETGEAYQMRLPDPLTGACPAGTDELYRTLNPRGNHRLTTSLAARAFSIGNEDHIAEGYGLRGVVGCVPRLTFSAQ